MGGSREPGGSLQEEPANRTIQRWGYSVFKRGLLRSQIRKAWDECIAVDYARQRINSERSLQASLWAKMNDLLDERTRRMFIEPRLSCENGSDSTYRYPDLVVCNTQSVIGIIELKYRPKGKPAWKKDVETMEWVAANRKKLSVQNKRYKGLEVDSRIYRLSPYVLFVWAGIHAKAEVKVSEHISKRLQGCFLELHAVTSRNRQPKVWWKG